MIREPVGMIQHALIEVRFTTKVMTSGSTFRAAVRNSSRGDSWQRVDLENRDATELVDSRTSRVLTAVQEGLIALASPGPRVMTPNGDGVNDVLAIRFALLKLRKDRPVEVSIFDLVGKQVRELKANRQRGEFLAVWDGRSNAGHLVPPGIYLCRVKVTSDTRNEVVTRVVYVMY
jgi:gliding motility-associated-like protein